MNKVITAFTPKFGKQVTLDELWAEASQYGQVNIYTHDSGHVTCTIEFATIAHCTLEAKSGYTHRRPHDALMAAIENAKKIQQQFKEK